MGNAWHCSEQYAKYHAICCPAFVNRSLQFLVSQWDGNLEIPEHTVGH